jgi:hypothetical protein
MDAYSAVISLHNLGYQLKALDGDQVAIKPEVQAEHVALISAIRKETKEACKAIQYLPYLCAIVISNETCLRNVTLTLFQALIENGYCRIIALRYFRSTGATEYVFQCLHEVCYNALQDWKEWSDCYECKEEGQRWRT